MNCTLFKDRLVDYTDGTLDAVHRSQADQHMTECKACALLVRQDAEMRLMLSRLPSQQTSALFEKRLAERLAAAHPAPKTSKTGIKFPFSRPSLLVRSAWAFGIAALAFVGIFFAQPTATSQKPASNETALISQCVALHQRDVEAQPLADEAPASLADNNGNWMGDTTSQAASQEDL